MNRHVAYVLDHAVCCACAQHGDQVVMYSCVSDEKRSETDRHLLKLDANFESTVRHLSSE